MSRRATPTWFFVLVVVRRETPDGVAYLVVHERDHGGGWYLPAGRVEPEESLIAAAHRETLEESGVPIVLDGILRIEHTPGPMSTRVRVIFLAHPADPDAAPRDSANKHSLGAAFQTLEQVSSLPLRGPEVMDIFVAVEAGAPVAPMTLLRHEGDTW